jgi:hypothetical protein
MNPHGFTSNQSKKNKFKHNQIEIGGFQTAAIEKRCTIKAAKTRPTKTAIKKGGKGGRKRTYAGRYRHHDPKWVIHGGGGDGAARKICKTKNENRVSGAGTANANRIIVNKYEN